MWKDHPRSRGEYWPVHLTAPSHNGSSPLSRGILSEKFVSILPLGIIPALAGNTLMKEVEDVL